MTLKIDRRTRYAFVLSFILAALGAGWVAQAGAPTFDDFFPPVQGGPADVKQPDQVKVQGTTVAAATAQDALNAAAEQGRKDLQAGGAPEVGAKMASFPGGVGFVATGAAAYRTMENATATRLAKRQAYVVAYTQAKKNLAAYLNGLSNDGKENVRESLTHVALPKDEMTNVSTQTDESVKQAVDMMLRGFVVYEVKDDAAAHAVYVTIVSTPKTTGRFARPAPQAIEADDLRDGMNQVLAEVKSGVVAPVGGRILLMRKTGETAFIGFGSAVVGESQNAAVQMKLNLSSQKIASMRAQDALCGLILGDHTSWEGGVSEKMHDEVREFEPLKAGDPLAQNNEAGVRKLDQARQTFVATMESSDTYASVRKGILPPGINTRTWFDDDHAWSYGVAVYVPSLTNAAAKGAADMREGHPLQPVGEGAAPAAAGSGFTDEQNPNVPRPAPTTRPGPTGKVTTDDQL